MNNYRLSTNPNYNGNLVIDRATIEAVFSLPSPYEVYPGYRTLTGTTNFVPESLCIIATKGLVTVEYPSLVQAGKALHIDRTKIKSCILSSKPYKGYTFRIKQ